jgi:hypothetical protein
MFTVMIVAAEAERNVNAHPDGDARPRAPRRS